MANKSIPTTQAHLDIEDIQEDLVLLKNGNISMVLETTSLNFELLSEEEQEVSILAFASLLNSLNFVMQIVVRTERKDVNDYIDRLSLLTQQQNSPALKKQMEIYISFIKNLTTKSVILDKRFFLVITTNFSLASAKPSMIDVFFPKPKVVDIGRNLQRAKEYLYPKREFLAKQFKKMGIDVHQLNTNQLIQLFYDIYDPDKVGVRRVKITDEEYTAGVVEPLAEKITN